jgi:hypothetical protein
MTLPRHFVLSLAAATALMAGGLSPASAQPTRPDRPAETAPPTSAPAVQRLHGVIDKDQTWTGTILITDDLTIQDATVTIAPGTIVEFAQAVPDAHPTLTVGSSTSATGDLRVLATAQQPIIFRTREGTNPGRMVVNVRSRIVTGQARGMGLTPATQPASLPNESVWRNVRFQNLGYARAKRSDVGKTQVVEPAVVFHVLGAPHSLSLSTCSFTQCTRLQVRAADGAKITLSANQFESPEDRLAVELIGDEGVKPADMLNIQDNVLAAILSTSGAAANIVGNILIGPDAAIMLKDDASPESRIVGNYVHNTTDQDDGRYCLNCENPNARIQDNVFRGGTACVLSGSKQMSGNVIIGAGRLASHVVKNARTHQLVGALPAGAVFEGNLLLGPAYSLLIPQPAALPSETFADRGPIVIRHNLFDGFGDSNRAIHVNAAGRPSAPIAVLNNVFIRVPTLVYDEGASDNTLTYADYNAAAPLPDRPFDQARVVGIALGGPGWAQKDLRFADLASLRLTAVPHEPPGDLDTDVSARKITVKQLCRRLFDAYCPRPGSPLVGAGRPGATDANETDSSSTIGPGGLGGRP